METIIDTTARPDAPSAEAMARAAAAAAAIPDEAILPIRVDVTAAASGVIGQAEAIEAHRAELVAVFGTEASEAIDALVPAAHQLIIANGRFNASGDRDLEPLAASLREKRNLLFLAASALETRGMRVDVLKNLVGGLGYVALTDDTQMLVGWFTAHIGEVGPHCKLTQSEVKAIEAESLAFAGAVGRKSRATAGVAAIARSRAFTHFARTYDRVRRFVTYVRFHAGDYDVIAPSIYAGRARKDATASVPAPTTNAIAPGMPGAPALGPMG